MSRMNKKPLFFAKNQELFQPRCYLNGSKPKYGRVPSRHFSSYLMIKRGLYTESS